VVHRTALFAILLSLAFLPSPGRHVRAQDPAPLVLSGDVQIVSGPNRTLVVLVDQDDADHLVDGLVDFAFRLQGALSLTFAGRATVTYVSNHVSVAADDGTGWLFMVAGRTTVAQEHEALLPQYEVLGLSRFWGADVHTTPSALATRLLSGASCARGTVDGIPPCDSCQAGGPGFTSCSIPCGGGTCGAECADNQFACCNCPLGCGCCPRINGRQP
jgi:hypothetical protein